MPSRQLNELYTYDLCSYVYMCVCYSLIKCLKNYSVLDSVFVIFQDTTWSVFCSFRRVKEVKCWVPKTERFKWKWFGTPG